MDSPSLLSRESTTLSFSNPQKGHFMRILSGSTFDCNKGSRWLFIVTVEIVVLIKKGSDPQLCALADTPGILENFIQCAGELARALAIFAGQRLVSFFQNVIFVGDIQGGENGQAQRIDGRGLLGHGAHFYVNIFGQLQNVVRIGSAKVINLIVNLNSDRRWRWLCCQTALPQYKLLLLVIILAFFPGSS